MNNVAIFVGALLASTAVWAGEKPKNCGFGLGDDAASRFVQNWYSAQLFALHEDCLPSSDTQSTRAIYRFLWLRSFHHPIVVRLNVQDDGSGKVVARENDGTGGYKGGRTIHAVEVVVSKTQVDYFLKQLEASDFATPLDRRQGGEDGAEWTMEFSDGAHYHMQVKWSPREGNAFRNACLDLLRLSTLETPKDIY